MIVANICKDMRKTSCFVGNFTLTQQNIAFQHYCHSYSYFGNTFFKEHFWATASECDFFYFEVCPPAELLHGLTCNFSRERPETWDSETLSHLQPFKAAEWRFQKILLSNGHKKVAKESCEAFFEEIQSFF